MVCHRHHALLVAYCAQPIVDSLQLLSMFMRRRISFFFVLDMSLWRCKIGSQLAPWVGIYRAGSSHHERHHTLAGVVSLVDLFHKRLISNFHLLRTSGSMFIPNPLAQPDFCFATHVPLVSLIGPSPTLDKMVSHSVFFATFPCRIVVGLCVCVCVFLKGLHYLQLVLGGWGVFATTISMATIVPLGAELRDT